MSDKNLELRAVVVLEKRIVVIIKIAVILENETLSSNFFHVVLSILFEIRI